VNIKASTPSVEHSEQSQHPCRRIALRMLAAAAALPLVAACGGGEDPPTVELSAIPSSGEVGATITLSATADDDDAVTEVRFYRTTGNSEELLATFSEAPYLFQTTIPTGASGTVTYMARAIDSDDQETDSEEVEVTVVS
jgi:hypothetical protein